MIEKAVLRVDTRTAFAAVDLLALSVRHLIRIDPAGLATYLMAALCLLCLSELPDYLRTRRVISIKVIARVRDHNRNLIRAILISTLDLTLP